jgi:hypothetical protein
MLVREEHGDNFWGKKKIKQETAVIILSILRIIQYIILLYYGGYNIILYNNIVQ